MEKKKIVNNTACDRDYYRAKNWGQIFNSSFNFVFMATIVITLYFGSNAVMEDNTSSRGWILCVLGLIVYPIIFYLIPFFYRKYKYSKEDFTKVATTTFDNDTITRHTGGRSLRENYSYDSISSMSVSGKYLSIFFTSGFTMHLDVNGFRDTSLEEVKEFLSRKTDKPVK